MLVVGLFFLAKKGFGFYKKIQHAKRLKIQVLGVALPKIDLSNFFKDILAKITVGVQNFSATPYNIEQVSIEVLSESGQVVAAQKNPLAQPISIAPNQNNEVPINFLLSAKNMGLLIKEAGGITTVGASFLTTGKYGIKLQLKGFVQAEGFTIPLNEKITV